MDYTQCLKRKRLLTPNVNKTVTQGQASSAKITSTRGNLEALACHSTKKLNKVE